MSYVSYSEDILKRHESDVFDLLRELENGRVSEVRQQVALPEFQELVRQLGALLSDPAQPAAMRLLDLRQANEHLKFDLERAHEKTQKLGATNKQLNEENLRLNGQLRQGRDDIRNLRRQARSQEATTEKRLAVAEAERHQLSKQLEELKKKISSLEMMALGAQVDRRY